jgi:broad specificity phosphatase PhoE
VLILVRHGRTDVNRERRLLGRVDVDLDEVGRRQAEALAAHVGPVDRIVASPLRRAQQTAAAWGVPVDTDERFVELDYGDLDGVPLADVGSGTWAAWRADLDFAPPGGESIAELGTRVREACDDLRRDAAAGDVVVVSHVSPIKAAVAWALGVGDEIAWRTFVAPASVTRIGFSEGRPSLRSFNDCHHLDAIARS